MPQDWRRSLTSYILSDLSFLDALRCGEPPFPDLATALEAHRVVAAAYGAADAHESAEGRRRAPLASWATQLRS